MARIIAGIGTSHTPAIGAAVDNGRTEEPYWVPLFKGYEPSKKWMAETKPDVAIRKAFQARRERPLRTPFAAMGQPGYNANAVRQRARCSAPFAGGTDSLGSRSP